MFSSTRNTTAKNVEHLLLAVFSNWQCIVNNALLRHIELLNVFITFTCLDDGLAATDGLQFQLYPRHYSRARHIRSCTFAYTASQIYARKTDVSARKIYDCSRQDENIKIQRCPTRAASIENPGNNTPFSPV